MENTKIIYKFKFNVSNQFTLNLFLPPTAKIVLAGVEDDIPIAYIEIGSCRHQDRVERNFYIVGTGEPYPINNEHRYSFKEGQFIWHIIEKV